MPEDVAYISSKSGVDTLQDGKVMSVAKKSADRQTAFCLYIVDYTEYFTLWDCSGFLQIRSQINIAKLKCF